MNKIVALCSGGFDSVVMLNYIKDTIPSAQVYILHFNYGQNNAKQENLCTVKVAEKLGYNCKIVNLPKFDWTKSEFFNPEFKDVGKQELEFRNLVFLSYALSYAKSIGANYIYAAILKSHGYIDTSNLFLKRFDEICSLGDVELVTPFSNYEKQDLRDYAFEYDVKPEDFFSCDTPKEDGEPCFSCPDCKILQQMYSELLSTSCSKILSRNHCNRKDNAFLSQLRKEPIKEARLYINNKCQLRCKHCYYGFDEMKEEQLTPDEMCRLIDRLHDIGVRNIHFSGKEPFFHKDIFIYTDYIGEHYDDMKYDVVTNGVNVIQYIDDIKEARFERVCISVDATLTEKSTRFYNPLDAIKRCKRAGIPVTVFIDITSGVAAHLERTLNVLYQYDSYSVRDFYIRLVLPIGNAKDFEKVSMEELEEVFSIISDCADYNTDAKFHLHIPHLYVEDVFKNEYDLGMYARDSITYGNENVYDNFTMHLETYCCRYENQITVTPDGFVLGCASETSCADYDKIASGNVKRESLGDIIKRGKEISCCANCRIENFNHCTFEDEKPLTT